MAADGAAVVDAVLKAGGVPVVLDRDISAVTGAKALQVDVADRFVDLFIWQNPPWALKYDGDPAQTAPGGDYLVAYWLGRQHAIIADDRPNTCARWH